MRKKKWPYVAAGLTVILILSGKIFYDSRTSPVYFNEITRFGTISCVNQDGMEVEFQAANIISFTKKFLAFGSNYITVIIDGNEYRLHDNESWICVEPSGVIKKLWPST